MTTHFDWYRVFASLVVAEQQMSVKSMRAVQVGARRVCLIRTAAGFFALQDFCPHNKAYLSKGAINDFGEVICPWHGYRFRIQDGQKAAAYACPDAQTFPIRIDEKGFCIGVPKT
ncbi:MAG: Rieske (2Fe-2S) protein [Thermonemataceae bacterium]